VCSLPSGQFKTAGMVYSVPSTRKAAPDGTVEIVIVLVVWASKHIPPKASSKSKENRFIDDTIK
jgi:hypothetical protein